MLPMFTYTYMLFVLSQRFVESCSTSMELFLAIILEYELLTMACYSIFFLVFFLIALFYIFKNFECPLRHESCLLLL